MKPLEFLHLLWQQKPKEPFILIWSLKGKQSYWFRDVSAAAEIVEKARGADVYVGVGLANCEYGPGNRCGSDEIAGIPGLWADLDLKSEAHNKPLPATIGEALTIIPAALPPTIIVSTGNGAHVWWLFKEPWIFENDGERKQAAALSSRFQTLLRYNANQSGWAFERLSDLARVLRIPGTVNAKDPGNPKEVEVHSSTDLRYNPSDFERYLNEQAIPDAGAEERAAKQFTERFTKQSLVINLDAAIPDDMLTRWVEQDARFRKTWERQRDDLNDQSGSGYDLALACFGIGNGLSDQQIVDLIVHHRRIHGEQRRTRLDYFQRTISRAAKSTGRPAPTFHGASLAFNAPAGPQSRLSGATSDNGTQTAETGAVGQTQKAQLCDRVSQILGVHILRLVKVPGKEPVYLMELEQGRIEFDVAKLTSQRAVNLAFAAKAGKIIPSFKPQPWRDLTQMMLDACTVVEGTDDLEFEGAARVQIDKYLSENPYIPTLEGTTAHDKLKPVVHQDKITVSATDLQIYINISTGQNYSVKAAAAMLAALGAQAVRVRGHGFREQSRWALPVSEFNPNDYGQNISRRCEP
jgi:hypothetical protein